MTGVENNRPGLNPCSCIESRALGIYEQEIRIKTGFPVLL